MGTGNLPPTRVLVGLGVTLLALLVLGVRACVGDGADGRGAAPTTTTTSSTSVPAAADSADAATTTVSIAILPDWYPKQSSRYSDREPVVTVTTLAPTSTTSTTSPTGTGDD